MTEENFLAKFRALATGYPIRYETYLQAVADYCSKYDIYNLNKMDYLLTSGKGVINMGDNNFSVSNIIVKSVDGTEHTIENVKIMPVPEEVEDLDTDFEKSFSGELSLTVNNISRKRFIKLLMARGIARNGAKDLADYVYKKYGHYSYLMLLTI